MFPRTHVPFRTQIRIVFTVALAITVIEFVNFLLDRYLVQFGLIPGSTRQWFGLFAAPLIHGSVMHYVSNIFPLIVFSMLLLQHGIYRYFLVTFFVVLVGGGAVWLFGRNAVHVGASGVIFGYFGFLLLAGILSREVKLIGISFLVGSVYGGIIFGVLPLQPGVSWEGHLFGFLSGLLAAFMFGRAPKARVAA